MDVGVCGGKDYWEICASKFERKSEAVMDDESGDGEGDEGDEDWLAIVIRLTELYFQSLTTLSLSEWSFCTAICISGVGFLVSLDHLQQS